MARLIVGIIAAFSLSEAPAAMPATIVNSTWLTPAGQYSDSANWSPAEVPNNSATQSFNITTPSLIYLDIDATVSNLIIEQEFYATEHSFTVTGSATVQPHGQLVLDDSTFVVSELTNYDAASHTLNGGEYRIGTGSYDSDGPSTFTFGGADIIHNAASLYLYDTFASAPAITDEHGNDGLRHFSDNEAGAVFDLSEDFTASSDFHNAGDVSLHLLSFTLPAGHAYRQIAGTTYFDRASIHGDVDIEGGELSTYSQLNFRIHSPGGVVQIFGDLIMNGGVLSQIGPLQVSGSATFADHAVLEHIANDAGTTDNELKISGTLTLGGTLQVDYPSPFPAGSQTQFFIASAKTITGSFSNSFDGRVSTMDGKGSFAVQTADGQLLLTDYQRAFPAAQLLNISTRAQVLTNDDAAIVGFIIAGTDAKRVLIRGLGPSLAASGVAGALQDPMLEFHSPTGAVITNDNWQDTQAAEISATGIAPSDAREPAILLTLEPGAYTAILRGTNNTSGAGLIEVYDLSPDVQSKLANISTRAFVDSDHVLIGGTIAGGKGTGSAELVVRGIGAGLQSHGIADFLPDPLLEVYNDDGVLVVANDDFSTPVGNHTSLPNQLYVSDPDAAIGMTVAPGNYTVIIRGKNGASGTALVEIYDLND